MIDLSPTPWFSEEALKFLETILTKDMSIFEYGSGGSTLYFSERAHNIVSVEHNIDWHKKVKQALSKENVDCLYIPPNNEIIGNNPADPTHYASSSIVGNFKEYVSSIDQYGDFDVILVDGRARASCLMHSQKKVKEGGWIVLDDADRKYYLEQTIHLFANWETVFCSGIWKTLFLKKPNE